MPKYEFECNHCKEKFELSLSMKERENARIVCPNCKSSDANQIYSGIFVNTRSSAKPNFDGCCRDCDSCMHSGRR
ncbi:MAG TPA: hypothetical protein GXX49_03955 [Clostridiaceae bacterium]|nr:hypothetical protein [Clostridiaceae bacterium]